MSEKEKSVPFTDAQKMLMEAPADDGFSRAKRDFFLGVGRDMVCSDRQELHKRLLSLDPKDWSELNAMKAIFNKGKWLDESATKAMIGLLTVLRISPDSVSEKTRDNLDSDSRSTLICIIIAVFFIIPILCCLHRDVMIVFGAGYFAAFPVAIAMHIGIAAFIGYIIYNSFFDERIVERHGYNAAAYNDKLLLQSQFGFIFDKSICENILFPFFDIENYTAQRGNKIGYVFEKNKPIKQLEERSLRKKIKKYILWGVISVAIVTILLLVGILNAKDTPLFNKYKY